MIEAHVELAAEIVRSLQAMDILSATTDPSLEAVQSEVHRQIEEQLTDEDRATALGRLAQVLDWAGQREEALPLAKQAFEQNATIRELVSQQRLIDDAKLNELLDPASMTRPI